VNAKGFYLLLYLNARLLLFLEIHGGILNYHYQNESSKIICIFILSWLQICKEKKLSLKNENPQNR